MKELLNAVGAERVSAAMRAVAGQRKHGARACILCGAIVEGLATRRYCSNACRQRAKYRRAHPEVQRRRRQAEQRGQEPPDAD
jgi:ferredoxin